VKTQWDFTLAMAETIRRAFEQTVEQQLTRDQYLTLLTPYYAALSKRVFREADQMYLQGFKDALEKTLDSKMEYCYQVGKILYTSGDKKGLIRPSIGNYLDRTKMDSSGLAKLHQGFYWKKKRGGPNKLWSEVRAN
jgi:hypothetical protein